MEYLYGKFCTTDGCELYDQITQRWTMDAGITTDRFSFTSVYSPNETSGFHNVYVNAYNLCSASYTTCGARQYPPDGPRDGSGSGVFSVSHSNAAKKYTKQEVDLFGSYTPSGQTIMDGAITGRAKCPAKSGACIFQAT